MIKKPKRRHPQPPPSRGPGLEEILSRAEALQKEGNPEEALRVLDEAPIHLQHRSELLILRGFLLASTGNMDEALSTFEEAQRREPDNLLVYYFLGMIYDELDMPAHARRALRKVMEYPDILPDELVRETRGMLNKLEKSLSSLAHMLKVSPGKVDEAEYQVELGYRMSQTGDFTAALRHLRRAASILPQWPILRGIEAEILAMAGRFREAVEAGASLLAEHPDMVLAREFMVRAYIALGNREAAEEVARPLREHSYRFTSDLELAIRALGHLNDDEGIYRLYRRHYNLIHEIDKEIILVVLGSAAANLGHFWTAQRLWEQAIVQGVPEIYLEPFLTAASRKAPGPGIADRYPTFQFSWFTPYHTNRELQDLLLSWTAHQIERKVFQKRLRALVARYPVLLQQMLQMFREAAARYFLAEALALLGTPEALEELRRFAFSQKERFEERMTVLQMLADAGGIDPEQPVEVWDEIRQEWRWLKVPRWTVVQPEEPSYPPKVLAVVQECMDALRAGEIPRAQERAKQALSLAPDHPDHLIWSAIVHLDDGAKYSEYLQKAVALDPRHACARAWLARLALHRGDLPEARRQLEALSDRQEFRPWEFMEYLHALALVSLEEGDLAMARFYTHVGSRWDAGDLRFLELELTIEARTPGSYWQIIREHSRQRQERKRTRPIRPDASLKECLERLPRESLVAMAQVHSLRYANLRKELLIQQLVEALTDPFTLRRAVSHLFEEERQALQDVLDAGGILPWEEFTARYGSDVEENQHWYYHKPETTMGRLRMHGFLSDGTVADQRIVLIPSELRGLLPSVLPVVAEDDAV